jgi:hypothetical protein
MEGGRHRSFHESHRGGSGGSGGHGVIVTINGGDGSGNNGANALAAAEGSTLPLPPPPPPPPVTKWRRAGDRVVAWMETPVYNVPMLTATVWALTSSDFRVLALPMSADLPFGIITFVVFLMFSSDLIASSLCRRGYFLRLFFWLDLLATVSLLTDIPFLTGASFSSELSIARAGRAARAGTRAGRLVRVFKLFKLVRQRRRLQKERQRAGVAASPEIEDRQSSEEFGAVLSDMTTQKVILGVMMMVAIIPLLDYSILDRGPEISIELLHIAAADPLLRTALINEFVAEFPSTVYLRFGAGDEVVVNNAARLAGLRLEETVRAGIAADPSEPGRLVILDIRNISQLTAGLQLVQTCFIVMLLAVGAAMFSRDANRMIKKKVYEARRAQAERDHIHKHEIRVLHNAMNTANVDIPDIPEPAPAPASGDGDSDDESDDPAAGGSSLSADNTGRRYPAGYGFDDGDNGDDNGDDNGSPGDPYRRRSNGEDGGGLSVSDTDSTRDGNAAANGGFAGGGTHRFLDVDGGGGFRDHNDHDDVSTFNSSRRSSMPATAPGAPGATSSSLARPGLGASSAFSVSSTTLTDLSRRESARRRSPMHLPDDDDDDNNDDRSMPPHDHYL